MRFLDNNKNMSRLYLIRNPEVFQGEKYLKMGKNYFEGWYFKNISKGEGISFIPGINIEETNKKAFIQVITNSSSYFIDYSINDFRFGHNPFYIKIGKNIFSKDFIYLDILDNKQNIKINGKIKYTNNQNIKTNTLSPNIMGPFSYLPFMECNHAILSMKNTAIGEIAINDKTMKFNNGNGYIEKDWGTSFPKSYIWCQGNNFKKKNASFMIAIADIPLKILNFRGIICDLILDSKEYKFTTYNNSKIIKYIVNGNLLSITLKKNNYYLEVKSLFDKGLKLSAPVKGKMQKNIFESISANVSIILRLGNKVIFSDSSTNCGIEVVK